MSAGARAARLGSASAGHCPSQFACIASCRGALAFAKRQSQRSPRRAGSLRVRAFNEVSMVGDEHCAPALLNQMSRLQQAGAGQLLRDDGAIGGLSGSAQ